MGLRVLSEDPYNAEPPPEVLAAAAITANESFFVRTHGPVPRGRLDVTIDGLVERPQRLEDLSAFPRTAVTASLQCAGNRRDELMAVRDIPNELAWSQCAIGTARWEGVRLRDLLEHAGLRSGASHVELIGGDDTAKGDYRGGFGGSIPRAKALADEVLLADIMNGEPLSPEHGAPVRVIVPGYIGARSVKWLRRISARAEPSHNPYHAGYAIVREHAPARVMGEVGVNSAILVPGDGAVVAPGPLALTGYAYAGDGSGIASVEVLAGDTVVPADLAADEGPWAWRLWRARVSLEAGTHAIGVRATAGSGESQPDDVAAAWNAKGYGNHAVHRITLNAG